MWFYKSHDNPSQEICNACDSICLIFILLRKIYIEEIYFQMFSYFNIGLKFSDNSLTVVDTYFSKIKF